MKKEKKNAATRHGTATGVSSSTAATNGRAGSPCPPPDRLKGLSLFANVGIAETYDDWIRSIKERVQAARLRALTLANVEQMILYWDIGREILSKQDAEGWGTKVVDRMATDLRETFPDMKGWSPRNLKYMRAFAEAWPNRRIVQQLVAQLPWGHNIILIDKLKSTTDRVAYAQLTIKNGWSRDVLVHQIEMGAAVSFGKGLTNFKATLPEPDSDLAVQTVRDEYNLSFLGAAEKIEENKLRAMLVDKVAKFLIELGTGFSYVGKALPIDVGGDEFEMDLLFYHVILHRYVVIELKTRKFRPQDLGQLSFYMTAIDRQVKSKADGKTIGLVLCKSRNDLVVEYALSDIHRPIGVSTYQLGLPPPEQLQAKLQKLLATPRKAKKPKATR